MPASVPVAQSFAVQKLCGPSPASKSRRIKKQLCATGWGCLLRSEFGVRQFGAADLALQLVSNGFLQARSGRELRLRFPTAPQSEKHARLQIVDAGALGIELRGPVQSRQRRRKIVFSQVDLPQPVI